MNIIETQVSHPPRFLFNQSSAIRFAGFFIGRQYIIILFDILDTLAACAMSLDFLIDFVQSKLRLKQQFVAELNDEASIVSGLSRKSRDSVSIEMKRRFFSPKIQNALLRRQKSMIKRLRRWNMDRWMPWPKLDVKVLLSFVLQGLFVRSSLCAQPGLHWTQLFGLLRLSCASRVLHFVQCAENNALLGQQLSVDRQLTMRIIKLLVRLAFITHVSACLWCTVARVGLGVGATEFKASPFFPSPEILSYDNGRNVFNSYSRAIHWAFVNLSGIGGVESVPTTSLECWTVLVVHMCGAIFYAIVTGSVITVLEEASQNENKIGSDIVKLSNFLRTARVSASSKERIIRGYMMRNVLTEGKDASGPVLDGLENGDEILETLPNYLRAEVGIYARAETIRRRVNFFTHCSNGFLVALSSSLSRTRTLLTGDYLIQMGEQYDHEFMVVESGTMQVRKDGQTVHTLRRGDCIGKSWLMGEKGHSSTMGLQADGTASVSIRALTPCIVMGGLTTREEVEKLEKSYAVDFKLLRAEARGHNKDENEKKAIAMRGIAKAVRRFKQRRMQRLQKEAALEGEGSADANEALVENFFNVSHDDLLRVVNEDA